MHAAVLGSPVAHSLSPVLHRAAYAALGLAGWSYVAQECDSERLPAVLAAARQDPEFGGFSLTMPLKLTALPLVDDLEPLARRVGAVNTVVPRSASPTADLDGAGLAGYNTDVPGMVAALHDAGVTEAVAPVVLGGGGSAQAALAALAVLGAPTVTVLLRDPARGASLQGVADAVGIELQVTNWGRPSDTDLIVSTVPAGAADQLAVTLEDTGWPGGAALFDILYQPWPTRLGSVAMQAGVPVVGGLELLVHQAVGQVELMTGRAVSVDVLRAAASAIRAAP